MSLEAGDFNYKLFINFKFCIELLVHICYFTYNEVCKMRNNNQAEAVKHGTKKGYLSETSCLETKENPQGVRAGRGEAGRQDLYFK